MTGKRKISVNKERKISIKEKPQTLSERFSQIQKQRMQEKKSTGGIKKQQKTRSTRGRGRGRGVRGRGGRGGRGRGGRGRGTSNRGRRPSAKSKEQMEAATERKKAILDKSMDTYFEKGPRPKPEPKK